MLSPEDIRAKLENPIIAHTGKYAVREGDTWEKIALKVYGDASMGELLAFFNEMISSDDLVVGEYVSLPTNTGGIIVDFFDIYGTDFALNNDGSLTIDENGDIKTVYGLANIVQAIENRLATVIGTYLYNLNYGLELFIGMNQSEAVINIMKARIGYVVGRDRRISSIDSIEVTPDKDALIFEINVSTTLLGKVRINKVINL